MVDGSPERPFILEITQGNVKNYCETVSADFRKSPARILFSQVAENSAEAQNRAAKLRTILLEASAIATSLWTQQSWLSAPDLKTTGLKFNNACPWLEAHPWNKVDEDSDKANGASFIVVVRLGLLAFDADDASGIDGDRYRVLVKSLVLIEDGH